MLKGIDIKQRIEFISKEDDSEPKTMFILRPFTASEMIGLSQFGKDGQIILSGSGIIDMVEKSIVEIKNFAGEFSKREIIESLSPSVLSELVTEISSINHLTGQDQKN